jgi:hypothetical protein
MPLLGFLVGKNGGNFEHRFSVCVCAVCSPPHLSNEGVKKEESVPLLATN